MDDPGVDINFNKINKNHYNEYKVNEDNFGNDMSESISINFENKDSNVQRSLNYVNIITGRVGKSLFIKIPSGPRKISLSYMLDTGASLSVISYPTFEYLYQHLEESKRIELLQPCKEYTRSATQHKMPFYGLIYIEMYIDNNEVKIPFHVTSLTSTPTILGLPQMSLLEIVISSHDMEVSIFGKPCEIYKSQEQIVSLVGNVCIPPCSAHFVYCSIPNVVTNVYEFIPGICFTTNTPNQLITIFNQNEVQVQICNNTEDNLKLFDNSPLGTLTPFDYEDNSDIYPLIIPKSDEIRTELETYCSGGSQCLELGPHHRHSFNNEAELPVFDLETRLNEKDPETEILNKCKPHYDLITPEQQKVYPLNPYKIIEEIPEQEYRQFLRENMNFNNTILTRKERQNLEDLLYKHKFAIYFPKASLGVYRYHTYKIKLKKDVKPQKFYSYKVPNHLRARVLHHLRELMRMNIIERCSPSGFLSPALLAFNRAKTKSRLIIDHRHWNQLQERDLYNYATVEDCITKIKGNIFVVLDLKWAFYHILLDVPSREYTKFSALSNSSVFRCEKQDQLCISSAENSRQSA